MLAIILEDQEIGATIGLVQLKKIKKKFFGTKKIGEYWKTFFSKNDLLRFKNKLPTQSIVGLEYNLFKKKIKTDK